MSEPRDPFWRDGKCVACESVMEEEGQHCDDCAGEAMLSALNGVAMMARRALGHPKLLGNAAKQREWWRSVRRIAEDAGARKASILRSGDAGP